MTGLASDTAVPAAAEAVADISRRLYAAGFVAATDGNVSARLTDGRILCTPSGVCKGDVRSDDIILLDADGRALTHGSRPSTELQMHLAYYAGRPDIGAVVHAHPPCATAFAAARKPMDACVFPEVIVSVGAVPLAPYATPSTGEVPASLRPWIPTHDAILLANHGLVTVGATVLDAWRRMEKVEHAARTLLLAEALGGAVQLTAAQVEALRSIAGASYGIAMEHRPSCVCRDDAARMSGTGQRDTPNRRTDGCPSPDDIASLVRDCILELGINGTPAAGRGA